MIEQPRVSGALAIATTAGFFAALGLLLLTEVPESSREVANIVVGALAAGWTMVLSYYFGSSQRSNRDPHP